MLFVYYKPDNSYFLEENIWVFIFDKDLLKNLANRT